MYSIRIFLFYILLIWGVRTHPTFLLSIRAWLNVSLYGGCVWRNAGQVYTTTGWVCTRRRLRRVMIRTGRRRGGTTAVRRRSGTGRPATRAQTTTTPASGSRRTAGRTLRAAPSTASLARRKQVIAEFHYTCPTGPDRTGPDQTKSAHFVGDRLNSTTRARPDPTGPARTFLRPAFPRNSVGSVRVSDKVRAGPVGSV